MAIQRDHSDIIVDGIVFDLSHLRAFSASIPGKGIEDGTDLAIAVLFSNHVYTERTRHGQVHHTVDHHGTKRTFDTDRYEMSKMLVQAIKENIAGNSLTHVSRSYGGIHNLVFVKTADGRKWTAIYCLNPLRDGRSVQMEVLSCYPKVIDQTSISRRNLSYFARMCLYQKTRIPKA